MVAEISPPARPDNRMYLELPARAGNLALIRAAVASFAAQLPFTLEELDDLKVALSEAVSNVILHAYRDLPEGNVAVWAELSGDTLVIGVQDTGRGIPDVKAAREPAFTTAPDRMGLGFVLMDNFMDEVVVESEPGRGTQVLMRKRTAPRNQGGSAVSDESTPQQPTT